MLTFDMRDFERASRRMGAFANQIPFALAGALNASAEAARTGALPEVWARSIDARNRTFLKAALSTKGTRATKKMLRVVVYDRFGRANLQLHDRGGRRTPRGRAIAVPSRGLEGRRGAHGVPKAMRPRNLPDSFVTDGRRPNLHLKQNAVYVRSGQYHKKGSLVTSTGKRRRNKDKTAFVSADSRKVRLMYVLRPAVPVRADVPFQATWKRSVKRSMPAEFRAAMRRAMATARKTK